MAGLPIFALPNLMLFEGAHLPNRLFETRYLEMVEDLSGPELDHLFCLPSVQEQVSFILDASKEALLTKRALDSLPGLDSPRDIGDGGGSEN